MVNSNYNHADKDRGRIYSELERSEYESLPFW